MLLCVLLLLLQRLPLARTSPLARLLTADSTEGPMQSSTSLTCVS